MQPRSVPLYYNGTLYASHLEADWACTFDALGWYFEYEPDPLNLGDGTVYVCDFRLPGMNIWFEVKGDHNERIAKTHRLYKVLREDEEKPGGVLVIVGRPAGNGGAANWHHVIGPSYRTTINRCSVCARFCFTQFAVDGWYCRWCQTPEALIPDQGYIPATEAKSLKLRLADHIFSTTGFRPTRSQAEEHFADLYNGLGTLPFARAPRRATARQS